MVTIENNTLCAHYVALNAAQQIVSMDCSFQLPPESSHCLTFVTQMQELTE